MELSPLYRYAQISHRHSYLPLLGLCTWCRRHSYVEIKGRQHIKRNTQKKGRWYSPSIFAYFSLVPGGNIIIIYFHVFSKNVDMIWVYNGFLFWQLSSLLHISCSSRVSVDWYTWMSFTAFPIIYYNNWELLGFIMAALYYIVLYVEKKNTMKISRLLRNALNASHQIHCTDFHQNSYLYPRPTKMTNTRTN